MGNVISAEIQWKDGYLGIAEEVLFCIGKLPKTYTDDNIFFYCDNYHDFQKLTDENNGEDFYITKIFGEDI